MIKRPALLGFGIELVSRLHSALLGRQKKNDSLELSFVFARFIRSGFDSG